MALHSTFIYRGCESDTIREVDAWLQLQSESTFEEYPMDWYFSMEYTFARPFKKYSLTLNFKKEPPEELITLLLLQFNGFEKY